MAANVLYVNFDYIYVTKKRENTAQVRIYFVDYVSEPFNRTLFETIGPLASFVELMRSFRVPNGSLLSTCGITAPGSDSS